MNVGVLGLGHLGTVTAARMTSDGHDVWRGHVEPPEVDEIWAVAGWQPRVWPTQLHRGLVHSSRRSALSTAVSIRRFSLISARKMLAIARHPGLSVGDYIDHTFVESGMIAATVQVIPSLPQTDIEVKVGVRRGARGDSCRGNMPVPVERSGHRPRDRSRRVTRDQAGIPSAPLLRGSSSGSSGTGGTTRVGLPALSVAVRPVRSRPWTVEVAVAVVGSAVPGGPAPLPGDVPDCAGQGGSGAARTRWRPGPRTGFRRTPCRR